MTVCSGIREGVGRGELFLDKFSNWQNTSVLVKAEDQEKTISYLVGIEKFSYCCRERVERRMHIQRQK